MVAKNGFSCLQSKNSDRHRGPWTGSGHVFSNHFLPPALWAWSSRGFVCRQTRLLWSLCPLYTRDSHKMENQVKTWGNLLPLPSELTWVPRIGILLIPGCKQTIEFDIPWPYGNESFSFICFLHWPLSSRCTDCAWMSVLCSLAFMECSTSPVGHGKVNCVCVLRWAEEWEKLLLKSTFWRTTCIDALQWCRVVALWETVGGTWVQFS